MSSCSNNDPDGSSFSYATLKFPSIGTYQARRQIIALEIIINAYYIIMLCYTQKITVYSVVRGVNESNRV